MPTPKKNEKQKDFIKRCIPFVIDEGTTKDPKQATAICFSIWKRSKKKAKGEDLLMETLETLKDNKNANSQRDQFKA